MTKREWHTRQRVRRLAAAVTFALFVVASPASAEENDVRVLQSDASGLVIEYVPLIAQPETVATSGGKYVRYRIGGTSGIPDARPGSPEMFARTVLLKFSGEQGNRVDILKSEYHDHPNVLLAPFPRAKKGELDDIAAYVPDPAIYGRAIFAPQEIASIAQVGETRGAFLGELRLSPLQYNPAQRVLRMYDRIIVRVTFGPTQKTLARRESAPAIALNSSAPALGAAPPLAVTNSVLSSGPWFRINVTDEGIYKLTGQALLAAGVPASTDPATIKVYGNGGIETPMDIFAPYVDDLLENAVVVYDGGTPGHLDASDYVLFYGRGTRGWSYSPTSKSFSHYINHFSETNTYWVTYGGSPTKMMVQTPSLAQPAAAKLPTVTGLIFREDENVNILSSGLEWLGQLFSAGGQMTYVHPLPGLDVTQPIKYRFLLAAQSSSLSQFTVSEHGSPISTVYVPSTVPGDETYPQIIEAAGSVSQIPTFTDGMSQLRFDYSSPSSDADGYIDWYELAYGRLTTSQGDVFTFRAKDTTAVVEYDVNSFSGSPVMVFDVTRFDSVVTITNPVINADVCSFQVQLTSGMSREYIVVGPGGFLNPGALTPVQNQNLHGDTSEVPYVIVTHPDFMQAALRLKAYREQPGPNALPTKVVDVNQIYNEFGGGLFTPVAIRNYLRYIYSNWSTPPRYVLFLGDGDFDYKRVQATGPDWIPPWESEDSWDPLVTYSSDDQFVTFNNAARVNIGLGRLTPQTLHDANTMVDKIIEYETNPVSDPWKVRCTFVADDGLQGGGLNDGVIHTRDAENVSSLVPPLFEKTKIYEYEYPTVYSAGGRRKPEVNAAIKDAINRGTLTLNFNGHGNPHVWTHEAIFVNQTDFPDLHNKGKYFFLVAATCNYADFDMTGEQSGAEILTAMPGAGAIGVFSATRKVFQEENSALNSILYQNIFILDSLGRVNCGRLGDIMYRTKQIHTTDIGNDLKYFLLGDPAIHLAFPAYIASVDSVNHIPTSQPVQLKALERASVAARVRDTATGQPAAFTGTAQVVVFDANQSVQIDDPTAGACCMTFSAPGAVLFRGDASVTNGAVGANFIVPRDISYSNNFGRIFLYFTNGTTDGAGFTTNVRIGGSDSTAPPDLKGPQIQLFLDSRGFRPGDVVSAAPLLIADLFDSSGINTSNSGIGHHLEAWLDDQAESIDLSDYYKSKTDTYRQGTVEYPLGSLGQGTHKLRLRAWDTYDNASVQQTVFNVLSGAGLSLTNVFNYPNPFTSSTLFTFEQNQVSSLDAEVKIYTLAGRMIQTLKETNVTSRFVRIPWDGRDRDGDPIANGVYLYKVTAKTSDGRYSAEAFGKLSILR